MLSLSRKTVLTRVFILAHIFFTYIAVASTQIKESSNVHAHFSQSLPIRSVSEFYVELPGDNWSEIDLVEKKDEDSMTAALAFLRAAPAFRSWLSKKALSWSLRVAKRKDFQDSQNAYYYILDRDASGEISKAFELKEMTYYDKHQCIISYSYEVLLSYQKNEDVSPQTLERVRDIAHLFETAAIQESRLQQKQSSFRLLSRWGVILVQFLSQVSNESVVLLQQLKDMGLNYLYSRDLRIRYQLSSLGEVPVLNNLLIEGFLEQSNALLLTKDVGGLKPVLLKKTRDMGI